MKDHVEKIDRELDDKNAGRDEIRVPHDKRNGKPMDGKLRIGSIVGRGRR